MKLTRLKHKHSFTEEGFTLIEVVIALGVVAIGILSLMALQLNTIKGNAFANTMTRATYTGSDVIELLLAKPYSDPVYASNDPNDVDDKHKAEEELGAANLASGVTGVTWTVIPGIVANTKDITVNVAYRDNVANPNKNDPNKSDIKNLILKFSRGKLL